MRLYFVGGIFPEIQKETILASSKGVIQNAADAFQLNILHGFDSILDQGVYVYNLPFVGSFPRRFSKLYIPGCDEKLFDRSRVEGVGFINLSLVKHFSRYLSLRSLLSKKTWREGDCFVVYSMHLPFIAALAYLKSRFPKVKICLIVPDLPEYMSSGTGFFYRFFKAIDTFLIKKFLTSVDCFVVLTSAMADKISVSSRNYAVVEGVATNLSSPEIIDSFFDSKKRTVFYSGTLAERYGVKELVFAFMGIEGEDYELWICGEGDSKGFVCDASERDHRIKYFGQLNREDILKMQARATILVNPRSPEGEYTRYSFPSKVIEYMSSGRPVVMHKLDGIPSEYDSYFFATSQGDRYGLESCLRKVLKMNEENLNEMGARAKRFVFEKKSPASQAQKIIDLIIGAHNEQ